MSTITSILSTDLISNSRATINTNFGNLNTDKLEAPLNASVIGSGTVTNAEFAFLDGVTANIQSQLDSKQPSVLGVSSVEIGYLDGITSSVVSINDTQILSNKTFITPSVASFAQAQHTHQNGAGGGLLSASSVFSMTGGQIKTSVLGTGTASNTTYLRGDSSWGNALEAATAAQVLSADVNSVAVTPSTLGANIKRIYKPSDQSTSSSVFVGDPDLQFPLGVNEVWSINMQLFYTAGNAPDIKFGWTVPVGTTMAWGLPIGDNGLTESTVYTGLSGTTGSVITIGIGGTVFASSVVGSVALRWAQNTNVASSVTTINKGTFMTVNRLA